MRYNVAVASTDGINIDKHFGGSDSFIIIKVNNDETYENLGERLITGTGCNTTSISCEESFCGYSCGGHNDSAMQKRIEAISDCRCVLCFKCGPSSQRQLVEKNIAVFEVNLKLDKALKKVIKYYKKSDEHESLRTIRK